jgi:hypothetical protein
MENSAELTYEQKQDEFALKQELEKTIHLWVERTFNFIQVGVLEKYCDKTLHDYIRNETIQECFEKWLSDCNVELKIKEFLNETDEYWETDDTEFNVDSKIQDFLNHDGSIKESFIFVFGEDTWDKFEDWGIENYETDITDYQGDKENYPVWNTCFEFRDSDYNFDEYIEKCISVGLGVIEGLEHFNNLVFMTSAGHSFYSAYWIPLYFKFYPSEAEKYKGINYSDL